MDAEVNLETDWNVVRRDEGMDTVGGFCFFARYRNFVGGEAWLWIGSTPVLHVNYDQMQ